MTVDGQVALVHIGLRQGCVLFNLVIVHGREKCMEFGVNILYKCGGKLVGEGLSLLESTIC